MSKDPTSRSDPMLFAADSLVSRFPKRESNELKTTPATSGRKCSDLSGNAGPLGLLEKTLLGSSNWAWTKYSLTWRAKATPQGRLIFQLARLAPRTSGSDSGLLHTPTAKANQMAPSMAPSMATSGKGNWVSTLEGAKPHHMVPTPTTMDHVERKSTNKTPSTGKLNYETNKSVSLDRWVRMWPTPKTPTGGSSISHVAEWRGNTPYNEKGQKIQLDTQAAVRMEEGMWPTPRTTGLDGGSNPRKAAKERGMWPTPRVSMAHGPSDKEIEQGNPKRRLEVSVQMFPTPDVGAAKGRGQKSAAERHRLGGSLNPKWVAWLMGYPIEYLSYVPWETRSSRKSRKK